MDSRLRQSLAPTHAARERRRLPPLSPGLLILAVAVVGSIAFVAFAFTVRDTSQIPLLSAGAAVLGIVFTALMLTAAVATYRAARDGRSGRALVLAILGGLVGMVACGAFAGSLILALALGR